MPVAVPRTPVGARPRSRRACAGSLDADERVRCPADQVTRSSVQGTQATRPRRRGTPACVRRRHRHARLPDGGDPSRRAGGRAWSRGSRTSTGAAGIPTGARDSGSLLFTAGSRDPAWRCRSPSPEPGRVASRGGRRSAARARDQADRCLEHEFLHVWKTRLQDTVFAFRQQASGRREVAGDDRSRRTVGTPLAVDADVFIARHLPCNDAWRRITQVDPCRDRAADLQPARAPLGAPSP